MRKARSGSRRRSAGKCCACARAARSPSGSGSRARRSPACSAVTSAPRCSCAPPRASPPRTAAPSAARRSRWSRCRCRESDSRRVALPDRLPAGSRVRAVAAAAIGLASSIAIALAARAWLPGPDPTITWYGYDVHDRRWLVLGYWLGVASLVFAPVLAVRSRAWWSASAAGSGGSERTVLVRTLVALAVYWLWLGPPWNVAQLARPMEWHELAHLGPIQALLAGKDFYLESGTQYGPGLLMFAVSYLEHFGVSLASFREFWLWTNFAGGAVLVCWLARLVPAAALAVGLLALRFF